VKKRQGEEEEKTGKPKMGGEGGIGEREPFRGDYNLDRRRGCWPWKRRGRRRGPIRGLKGGHLWSLLNKHALEYEEHKGPFHTRRGREGFGSPRAKTDENEQDNNLTGGATRGAA